MATIAHSGQVYRPDIDGLRAIAVLGVVIYHAFPKSIPGGFVGVDVFFVISGFLITSILMREMQIGQFSFIDFYARRARRIFPALVITCLLTTLLGWFLLVGDEYRQLGSELGFGAAFLANFNYYSSTGYFDRGEDSKYLLHLWSLAVEEQYYVFWPVLLYLLHRSKISIATSLATLLVASFLANIYFTSTDSALAFYMPFTRLWELGTGSLLACLSMQKLAIFDVPKHGSLALSLIGITLITFAFFAFDKTSDFPGWRAAVPVLGTALVIASPPNLGFNRILSNRWLVALGLISFPVYLLHWPLLTFAKTIAILKPSVSMRLLVVAVSVVGAIAIYRFVERPLRQSNRLRVAAATQAMLLMAIGFGGFLIFQQAGFPSRWAAKFGPDVAAYKVSQHTLKDPDNKCKDKNISISAECKSTLPLKETDVALIGDSHAGALYEALSIEMQKDEIQLAWFGGSACPYLIDLERDKVCGDDAEKLFDDIDKLESIKTVILASRWSLYATNLWFGSAEESEKRHEISAPSNSALVLPEEILFQSLNKSVAQLLAANKSVVLLLNVPELGIDPSRCVARPFRSTPIACVVKRVDFESRSKPMGKIVKKLKEIYPEIVVFDPSNLLCNETECHGRDQGGYLYRDDDHVSFYGASKIASAVVLELKKIQNLKK
jgi:peptidoglycan/LPS O-acetylase OafA/YrhL